MYAVIVEPDPRQTRPSQHPVEYMQELSGEIDRRWVREHPGTADVFFLCCFRT